MVHHQIVDCFACIFRRLKTMNELLNCFCGMVDRRKAFSLISTPRAGFEPAQNLSSGLVEGSCAVVITTTPRRWWTLILMLHIGQSICLVLTKCLYPSFPMFHIWWKHHKNVYKILVKVDIRNRYRIMVSSYFGITFLIHFFFIKIENVVYKSFQNFQINTQSWRLTQTWM